MSDINEIQKYIIKYSLLQREQKERFFSIFDNDVIDQINEIYDEDNDTIIVGAISSFSFLRGGYETLYLTAELLDSDKSNVNEYFCYFYLLSLAELCCDYYNTQKRDDYVNDLAFHGSMLLMSFACNRFDLIEHCYPKIKESLLNGKMSKSLAWGGDGEGNVVPPTPQRLGVLAIEMMASEHKQTIDWHSVNIPTDSFYVRFCQEALYEKDENIVKEWLMELCDNHLKWSSLFLDNNKSSITGHEIEQPVLLLWPFEYQAVKNFRARHGLTTPEIDHPLLKTPMAIDHRPDFSQWHKPEWFQPVMDKLKEANPALAFLPDLFK